MDLHQVAGIDGAYEALSRLADTALPDVAEGPLASELRTAGVTDPLAVLAELSSENLVKRSGEGYAITHAGLKTRLLIEAMNGADIALTFRKLSRLEGISTYELVREGMTTEFLDSFTQRPGFGVVYFCSPWINLDRRSRLLIASALVRMEQRRGQRPELFVLTRPVEGTRTDAPDDARYLQALGAAVYLNSRLHSKLYIREPGISGGYSMAILGSQNLTRSTYLELGIRVNGDTQMITRLTQYFWDVSHSSIEI